MWNITTKKFQLFLYQNNLLIKGSNFVTKFSRLDETLQRQILDIVRKKAEVCKKLNVPIGYDTIFSILQDAENGVIIEPDNDGQRVG